MARSGLARQSVLKCNDSAHCGACSDDRRGDFPKSERFWPSLFRLLPIEDRISSRCNQHSSSRCCKAGRGGSDRICACCGANGCAASGSPPWRPRALPMSKTLGLRRNHITAPSNDSGASGKQARIPHSRI